MSEQVVIVRFTYGQEDCTVTFDLEDQLIAAFENAGIGEVDGDETVTDYSHGSL